MATIDFPAEIKALRSTLKSIESVSDPAMLQERIEMLSDQAASPDLWDDQDNAQKVTSALSHAQSELERVKRLASRIDDVETLVELGNEMEDADSLEEAQVEVEAIRKDLRSLEVRTLLDGEYDARAAVAEREKEEDFTASHPQIHVSERIRPVLDAWRGSFQAGPPIAYPWQPAPLPATEAAGNP